MSELSTLAKYKITPDKHDLVMKNQGLIRTVIRDMFSVYHEYYDDMFQEGMIGLIKAVSKYDPNKGAQLSTFAYWCIKNEIQKFVSECTDPIRVPVSVGLAINGVRQVEERGGTEEEKDEVLNRIQISKEMLNAGRRALSYTSMDSEIEEGVPLRCMIPAEPYDYTDSADEECKQLYNDFHRWLNYNYPNEFLNNRIFIDYIYITEQQLMGTNDLYRKIKATYGVNRTIVNEIKLRYCPRLKTFLKDRRKL